MKPLTAVVVLLAAGSLLAPAQDDEDDFAAEMKAANRACERLQKMESKTGEQAVRDAERIGGIYEVMIEFWRQRNAPNAVVWSRQGKADAAQLASAANAGDAARAGAAFQKLSGTCQSCHETYRQQTPDGKYRFR